MKVTLKGSIELQDGTEKATIGIPEGGADDFHLIKKAVRAGKEIELIIRDSEPTKGMVDLRLINQMILDKIDEEAERKIRHGKGGLFDKKNGGGEAGTGIEGDQTDTGSRADHGSGINPPGDETGVSTDHPTEV